MEKKRIGRYQRIPSRWVKVINILVITCLFSLFFGLFDCLGLAAQPVQTETKKVLILPSYNFNYLGSQWFLQGVFAEFAEHSPYKVTYYHENLQLSARSSDEYYNTMAESLKVKYLTEKPDLIIVQYKQALQFMSAYGTQIFGNVPVVYAGLESEDYHTVKVPDHYNGILATFSANKNIELVLHNHPAVKMIYVVGGSGSVEKDLVNSVIQSGRDSRVPVEFIALNNLPFPELLARIDAIKGDAAIMYQAFQVDAAGNVFVPAEVAKEIGRVAHVPVYGMLDTYEGSGITGGFLISQESMGSKAAEIGIEILLGKRTTESMIQVEPIGAYWFDWRQLQRWGIDENRLPAGSKIDFKETSFWELYKWQIIGGICLVVLQGLLICGLLINRIQRKRMQAALEESEKRFRLAMDLTSEGLWDWDVTTDKAYFSPGYYRMLGFEPNEFPMTGQAWLEKVHPDDRARALKQNQDCIDTQISIFKVEFRMRSKSGEWRWILGRGAAVSRDDTGKALRMLGTHLDITERKLTEEALQKSESRFRHVAEHAIEWIWEVDQEGLYTYASPMVEQLLGYQPDELVGEKHYYDLFCPEQRDYLRNFVEQAVTKRENIHRFVNPNVHKNGSVVILETNSGPIIGDNGELLGYRGSDIDITERKRSEEALIESNERYQALVKQSSEAIIVYEYETRRIQESNKASVAMFGYSEEELRSMTLEDIMIISDDELARFVHAAKEQGGFPAGVARYRHKDGHIVYAERSGTMIHHRGRQLTLVSYHDITEERKLQRKIHQDIGLAGKVQKAMLPGDYQDDKVSIRTIYQPANFVSGDYFGYRWIMGGQVLNGFVLDVTGHGLATALQTAAINAVLNDELERNQVWSLKSLTRLNSQVVSYLPEGSFAAVLAFSFDFRTRTVTCISGGINYYLSSTSLNNGWVGLPGRYLGISEKARLSMTTTPFQHGDTFYFPTDGIADSLDRKQPIDVHNFQETMAMLEQLATDRALQDDCSALCLQITAFKAYPLYFTASAADKNTIRLRWLHSMETITGGRNAKVDTAVGEAVMNAFQYGTMVRVKINKLGSRLIIRVKDDGPGFSGNEAVTKVLDAGIKETFKEGLLLERGRGIPIMLSYMDRVIYNRRGNEIMLVKRL
ncbi:MAG: PAS domain S-box protein [Negativicutes bacterium]|nr:PAS domain S-box protein [Negativicutes bacterium]